MKTRDFKRQKLDTAQSFSIMVSTTVMPDGFGDGAHADHMLTNLKKQYPDIEIIRLIKCFVDKKEKLIQIMKEQGSLVENTQHTDDCFAIQEKNPNTFLVTLHRHGPHQQNDENPRYNEEEHDRLRASEVFREKLRSVKLIVNVSNFDWLKTFQDEHYGYQRLFLARPRILHFPEHGCPVDPKKYPRHFDQQYTMGFKNGLFLTVPPERKKEEVLASIKSKKFLSLLLNQPYDPEQKEDEQATAQAISHFAHNVLFFPGYYKYVNSSILHLLIWIKSPLFMQSGKNENVFLAYIHYTAEQNPLTRMDFLEQLYLSGIGTLEIVTENKNGIKKEIFNLRDILTSLSDMPKVGEAEHLPERKTLRVMNTWVPSDDFPKVFELVKGEIAGASGDKSLETVIANTCVPLYEMRSYKANGMRKEIEEEFKGTLLEKIMVEETKQALYTQFGANCIWHKCWDGKGGPGTPIIQLLTLPQLVEIAERIAPHLTPENIKQAQPILNGILQNKNLNELLPGILEKEIKAAFTPQPSMVSTFINSPPRTTEPPAPANSAASVDSQLKIT